MAKKMAAAELQLLCIDTESKFISTGFAKEVAVRLSFFAIPLRSPGRQFLHCAGQMLTAFNMPTCRTTSACPAADEQSCSCFYQHSCIEAATTLWNFMPQSQCLPCCCAGRCQGKILLPAKRFRQGNRSGCLHCHGRCQAHVSVGSPAWVLVSLCSRQSAVDSRLHIDKLSPAIGIAQVKLALSAALRPEGHNAAASLAVPPINSRVEPC